MSTLLEKGEISPHMTGKLWASRERGLLKSWEEKGWVSVSSEIVGGRTKVKGDSFRPDGDRPDGADSGRDTAGHQGNPATGIQEER